MLEGQVFQYLDVFLITIRKKHKFKKIVRKIWFPTYKSRKKELYNKVVNYNDVVPLEKTDRNYRIIVSLTTFPARFNSVTLTLKSLLMQTVRPDKIVVWYDCNERELTSEMYGYEIYGVEYKKASENIGPHKKYFDALQIYNEDIVICVDDDLVYPIDMIESLMNAYKEHPQCVCARRVHKIKLKVNGEIDDYDKWIGECFFMHKPSHLLMATTGAGTLYPPNIFSERMFDTEKIKGTCLYADDIWMKYLEIISNVKVVWAKNNMPLPPTVEGSQITALDLDNLKNGRNNIYIRAMNEVYGEEVAAIIKKDEDSYKKNVVLEWIQELLGEQISYWRE